MKIVAIGAHPDDIEIGVGGVLAKYSRKGHEVHSIIVTIPYSKEIRWKETENAAKILGVELRILDLDPNEIVFSRKLVKEFDTIINEMTPDLIFTHWNHDSHQDHVAVSNAAIAATRKNNCSVYMYEQTIPGGIVPYGFKAQMFVDISDVIELKVKSTLAHRSQVERNGEEQWVEGVKGRAMYRGYQINVKYAEAFEVLKEILG